MFFRADYLFSRQVKQLEPISQPRPRRIIHSLRVGKKQVAEEAKPFIAHQQIPIAANAARHHRPIQGAQIKKQAWRFVIHPNRAILAAKNDLQRLRRYGSQRHYA